MARSPRQLSLASIPGSLLLVGAGKMGGALLDGWLARKLPPKKVVVLEPSPSKEIKALARRVVTDAELSRRYRDVASTMSAYERGEALTALDDAGRQ